MSTAIKRKSAITTAAFKNWTEHSFHQCHKCDRIRLLQKGVLGTQKFGSKTKSTGRPKTELKLKVTKFLWFTCSANKISNTSCSNITRSQQWGFKSPYFSLHTRNLLKNNRKTYKNFKKWTQKGKTEIESECPSYKKKDLKNRCKSFYRFRSNAITAQNKVQSLQ